jgi:hypothetical protein
MAELVKPEETALKSRPPRRRKPTARAPVPPEVPEVARPAPKAGATGEPKPETSDIPEHIRRMLEAAYT